MAEIVFTRFFILIAAYIIILECLQFQEAIKEYRIGLVVPCTVYLYWFIESYRRKSVFYKKTSLHKGLIIFHIICCISINISLFITMFLSDVLSGMFIIILFSLIFCYVTLFYFKGGIII